MMLKDYDELAAQRRDAAISAAVRIQHRLARHDCAVTLLDVVQGRLFGLVIRRHRSQVRLGAYKVVASVTLPPGRRIIRQPEAVDLLTKWADAALATHVGTAPGRSSLPPVYEAEQPATTEDPEFEPPADAATLAALDCETIDAHVGLRIRLRRAVIRQNQTELARACGVTFQQIQKYETGTNRVSASRLVKIAAAQGLRPEYYFEGLADACQTQEAAEAEAELIATARLLNALPPEARVAVTNIAKSVIASSAPSAAA